MQMNRLCIIGYFLTWRLALARVHCTYSEKYAEARIRVYDGKQNCARLDLAIAQEAYTGNWTLPLFGPLICIGIENELSEFSVIRLTSEHYGAIDASGLASQLTIDHDLSLHDLEIDINDRNSEFFCTFGHSVIQARFPLDLI